MTYSSSSSSNAPLWLGLSIGATVMCCMPLGIVGIVYAAKGMGEEGRGDYYAAVRSVESARNWTIASAIALPVVALVFLCASRANL